MVILIKASGKMGLERGMVNSYLKPRQSNIKVAGKTIFSMGEARKSSRINQNMRVILLMASRKVVGK